MLTFCVYEKKMLNFKALYFLLIKFIFLMYTPYTIVYTTNGTALKNKRKSNDAKQLVTCVIIVSICKYFQNFPYL